MAKTKLGNIGILVLWKDREKLCCLLSYCVEFPLDYTDHLSGATKILDAAFPLCHILGF